LFLGFLEVQKGFLKVLKRVFKVFKGFKRFLYEDRTRKYDPKAHEEHPIHGTPYFTEDKSILE